MSSRPPVSVVVADHWSYTGVGWTLGLESSVASLRDAFALAESELAAKTSVNLDAHAYERLVEEYPHVAAKLKALLDRGMLDIVGGTFGQPLATTISGESNLRQLVEGRRAIQAALGFEVETFLEQEEFSHPQVPQLLLGCGYRYASLAQSDTWGRQGVPIMPVPVVDWVGADGSRIRSTTRNRLCFHTWSVDWAPVLQSDAFAELARNGPPLITKWEEFGWDVQAFADAQGLIRSLGSLAELADTRFVTIGEYLDAWDGPVEDAVLVADDWERLLAWGIGGDQLRRAERLTEAELLAAETLDCFAHLAGAQTRAGELGDAWRDLMAAQSHDVALCEYTVGVLASPPLHPREELFNASWGMIGFEKLRSARAVAARVSRAAIAALAAPGTADGPERRLAVVNPAAHARSEVVESPLLDNLPPQTQAVAVIGPDGEELPAQLAEPLRRDDGALVATRVLFEASLAPLSGAGYRLRPGTSGGPASQLETDADAFAMANAHLRVEIDPRRGGIARLAGPTGELLLGGDRPSPRFHGDRNPDFPLTGVFHYFDAEDPTTPRGRPAGEHRYDSATAAGEVEWIETGPVRATIRCVSRLDLLRLETYVSLSAQARAVTLRVRVAAEVPPDPKIFNSADDWVPVNLPADGYWLAFGTAFPVRQVVRDLPYLAQETTKARFEALSFVDLIGDDRALLIAHGGTQHFHLESATVLNNLVMREWESYFGNHFGWPPVADYDFRLVPHEPGWTNLERHEASRDLLSPLVSAFGELPDDRVELARLNGQAELSCLRAVEDGQIEARLVEYDGASGDAAVQLPGVRFAETDHRGTPRGPSAEAIRLRPFGVHTLRGSSPTR